MVLDDIFIKFSVNSKELDKVIKRVSKALQWLAVQTKKYERQRMRELVFKYGYLKDYLKSPVQIKKIVDIEGNIVALTLKNKIITCEEEIALSDWVKVLEGYNPNWSWKMIADYEKEKKKMETIKKYKAYYGTFLGEE